MIECNFGSYGHRRPKVFFLANGPIDYWSNVEISKEAKRKRAAIWDSGFGKACLNSILSLCDTRKMEGGVFSRTIWGRTRDRNPSGALLDGDVSCDLEKELAGPRNRAEVEALHTSQ